MGAKRIGEQYVEHNGSGYADPTADAVLRREHSREIKARENEKYTIMVKRIKKILDDNNYVLDGPISLINVVSGRKRRIY
jgi:hypothetical protein